MDLVRRPPDPLAAAALKRTPCPHRAHARGGSRQGDGRGHWAHPARRGGPAADVLCPDRAPAASWGVPVITDRLPTLGAAPVERARGRRVLGRLLARPSLPPWSDSWSCVVVFGIQAPTLLTSGGLASVLDVAALLGHRRGGRGPAAHRRPVRPVRRRGRRRQRRWSPPCSSAHAGWGTWPALAASLAVRPADRPDQRLAGGQHRAAELPGDARDLPRPAGDRRRPAPRRWPARPASTGLEEADGWAVGRGRVRLDHARSATAASGSRCCGCSAVTAAGDLGAVAHPLRQRRLRQRRRAPGRPPARRPGRAGRRWRCSASPPRRAG